jgi:hypothetical protein
VASVSYANEHRGKRAASLGSISSSAHDVKKKLKTDVSIPIDLAFDSLDVDTIARHLLRRVMMMLLLIINHMFYAMT